ncbi:fimbrial protein [Dyella psychrodurans]|nr:fimbrial protein [Dyella psychrodurans]
MNMLKYLTTIRVGGHARLDRGMNNLMSYPRYIVFALLLLLSGNAAAQGTGNGWCTTTQPSVTITLPASITIQNQVPVGTPLTGWLGTNYIPIVQTCYYINITGPWTYSFQIGVPASGAGTYSEAGLNYTIYPTNVTGVGVVIGVTGTPTGEPMTGVVASVQSPYIVAYPYQSIGWTTQAKFIQTGPLSPGTYTINSQQVATLHATQTGVDAPSALWVGTTQFIIPAPTCSLSTSSATFNMGTLVTSSFNGGVGHEYGWVADQSLISGGCNANTVSMTFAGTAAAAPYTNAFANNGTATGVAMELWQASGSQAIPNGGAINFAPQGAGGPYTFSARYIQTAPTVTAGSVNATVTVTVNYQ